MKKYIGLLLGFALLGLGKFSFAAGPTTNEPAASDGNTTNSEIAVTYTSTGNTIGTSTQDRSFVTRRIRVENDGTQDTTWGVHRTSMSAVATSTAMNPMDVILTGGASIYVNGSVAISSGILINTNVLAVASPSRPVLLRRVRAGNQIGAPNTGVLVRLWDSRGSTTPAANVQPLFEETLTTGAVRDIDVWCSSGIVRMIGSSGGIISVDFDEFNTNNQDSR